MIRGWGILGWIVALCAVGTTAYLVGSSGSDPTRALMYGAAIGVVAMLIWLLVATVTLAPPQVGQDLMRHRLTEELYRSRRRGHALSLVRVRLSEDVAVHPQLRAHLRQMDHLDIDGGYAYLLLPEALRSEAERLVERLRATVPAAFCEHPPLIAVFPEDGVTERALSAAVGGQPFFNEPLGKVALPDVESRRAPPDVGRVRSERRAPG